MHQEYCRTLFTSLARSIICLALVAPVCDNADADDKLKGPHSTPRTVSGSSDHSGEFHHSLQGRTPAVRSGIYSNNNSPYRGGFYSSPGQQDRRKKQSVTGSTGITSDKNNDVQRFTGETRDGSVSNLKTPDRPGRISGIDTRHEQVRKHTGKHTGNSARLTNDSGSAAYINQGRYSEAKTNNNDGYKSIGYRKHYDNSGSNMASEEKYSGKNEKNRYHLRTHHNHYEYRNKYRNHKKYIVKRYPLSHLIFIGYSFVPFSYYTYYNYYYPGELSYSPSVYGYNENYYFHPPSYNRENSGWVQLSNGQIMAALESFSREMEHYPDAGIPKVGYALAVAASGDLISAVLAMREALRYDPDSLQYIYLDEKLFDLVDSLIEKYEYQLQFDNRRPDEAFMAATLYYLEQDYISAHNAVGRAISDGDKSASISNLHGIINTKLQDNYAGDYN